MITNTHDLENDRQADEAARSELELEAAQSQLSDDLFDAYVSGNGTVIEELDARLSESESLVERMRVAMTTECQRPVMGRGGELYRAYQKIVSDECDALARTVTADKMEDFRDEYGI